MRFLFFLLAGFLVVALILGCDNSGSSGGGDGDTDSDTDADTDTDTDTDTDSDSDPTAACETLGLPSVEMLEGDGTPALYAIASDFTVTTTDLATPATETPWTLSENWSGCDNYLFIQDTPSQVHSGFGYYPWDDLVSGDFEDFFSRTPQNVHYFFLADQNTVEDAAVVLADLKNIVDGVVVTLPDDDQAWWADRLHYVKTPSYNVDGWIGDAMASPGFGMGIDRIQRLRYVGSYADPTRYNGSVGWFGPNVSMVVNEPIYYNFEATREAEMIDSGDTVVEIFANDNATEDDQYATVDLPAAGTMAGFDTMMFDLYLGCIGTGEFGTCPAWDYLVYLYLCDDETPDSCTTEIGRWITTYHREGRWVHDVSGLLPLLADGGTKYFRFYSANDYELHLDIRFSTEDKPVAPSETIPLFFGGGTFNPTYNDAFDEMTVAIPSDAVKVELATVITGHGMAQPGNCNEFCNTQHHFYVNGPENDNMLDFPVTEDDPTWGCMNQVDEGTVPNQYGTWWYGRGGWCPGMHVPLVMTDITSQVTVGEENTFDYEGFRNGEVYDGDNWNNIRLASWLVVSK